MLSCKGVKASRNTKFPILIKNNKGVLIWAHLQSNTAGILQVENLIIFNKYYNTVEKGKLRTVLGTRGQIITAKY